MVVAHGASGKYSSHVPLFTLTHTFKSDSLCEANDVHLMVKGIIEDPVDVGVGEGVGVGVGVGHIVYPALTLIIDPIICP